MAFGNYNSGSSKKEVYSPTVYSPVRFYNTEQESVDKTTMSFSYWKGLLKITINPVKVSQGSPNEIDRDNNSTIYLSPMKALLLYKYGKMFLSDTNKYINIGVPTHKGIIYLTNGKKEFGLTRDQMIVVIKTIDSDSGNITSEYAYEFNSEYNFGVSNWTGGSDFNKDYSYSNSIEFEMFLSVLKTYVDSSSYAYAASVADAMKIESNRNYNSFKAIQEKLGISSGNKGSNYSNKSYFNNNNNGNSNSQFNNNNMNSSNSSSPDNIDYEDLINDINDMM